MKILIALLLTLNFLIGENKSQFEDNNDELGRYFYYTEVDEIVLETADKVSNRVAQAHIDDKVKLKAEMLTLIDHQKKQIEELKQKYEEKIVLINQKNALIVDATKIKYQSKYKNFFWTGALLGVGITTIVSVGSQMIQINPIQVTF